MLEDLCVVTIVALEFLVHLFLDRRWHIAPSHNFILHLLNHP